MHTVCCSVAAYGRIANRTKTLEVRKSILVHETEWNYIIISMELSIRKYKSSHILIKSEKQCLLMNQN